MVRSPECVITSRKWIGDILGGEKAKNTLCRTYLDLLEIRYRAGKFPTIPLQAINGKLNTESRPLTHFEDLCTLWFRLKEQKEKVSIRRVSTFTLLRENNRHAVQI